MSWAVEEKKGGESWPFLLFKTSLFTTSLFSILTVGRSSAASTVNPAARADRAASPTAAANAAGSGRRRVRPPTTAVCVGVSTTRERPCVNPAGTSGAARDRTDMAPLASGSMPRTTSAIGSGAGVSERARAARGGARPEKLKEKGKRAKAVLLISHMRARKHRTCRAAPHAAHRGARRGRAMHARGVARGGSRGPAREGVCFGGCVQAKAEASG